MSRPGPPNVHGTGPTRLRQIALVARDLKKAEDLLTYVLGTEVIYVDPSVEQWGLKNFLVPVGGDVIEVVSPFKSGTTAGRLLEKIGGDGGYMIIMQNADAQKRKEYIEEKGLGKVIHGHAEDGIAGYQYHPKWVPGGVIPELASHAPTKDFPNPLTTKFSPWYPCGPDTQGYISKMQKYAHLSLLGVVCRLKPGDWGGEKAASQWEATFGVSRSRDQNAFTNARLGFLHGEEGEREGIMSISIGVKGDKRRQDILKRAEERGAVCRDGARWWIEMVGVQWNFSLTGDDDDRTVSKL